jgi:tripartite motif-containing protein 27
MKEDREILLKDEEKIDKETKCDLHDDRLAENMCSRCGLNVCGECAALHQKKRHPLRQIWMLERLNCPKHQQDLSLFCKQCESLVCLSFCVTVHRNHEITELSEIRSSFNDRIVSTVQTLEEALLKLNEKVNSLNIRTLACKEEKVKSLEKIGPLCSNTGEAGEVTSKLEDISQRYDNKIESMQQGLQLIIGVNKEASSDIERSHQNVGDLEQWMLLQKLQNDVRIASQLEKRSMIESVSELVMDEDCTWCSRIG